MSLKPFEMPASSQTQASSLNMDCSIYLCMNVEHAKYLWKKLLFETPSASSEQEQSLCVDFDCAVAGSGADYWEQYLQLAQT